LISSESGERESRAARYEERAGDEIEKEKEIRSRSREDIKE